MADEEGRDLDVSDPNAVALEEATRILRDGVTAMRSNDYVTAIKRFEEVYKSDSLPKPVSGLSYYGLCLAKVRKQHREAIDMCTKAVGERPDDAAHWANLTEVYLLAGRRVKAVNTIDEALQRFPRTKILQDLRARMGKRRKPVVPFLSRNNVVNQILGHIRHTWNQKQTSDGKASSSSKQG